MSIRNSWLILLYSLYVLAHVLLNVHVLPFVLILLEHTNWSRNWIIFVLLKSTNEATQSQVSCNSARHTECVGEAVVGPACEPKRHCA